MKKMFEPLQKIIYMCKNFLFFFCNFNCKFLKNLWRDGAIWILFSVKKNCKWLIICSKKIIFCWTVINIKDIKYNYYDKYYNLQSRFFKTKKMW